MQSPGGGGGGGGAGRGADTPRARVLSLALEEPAVGVGSGEGEEEPVYVGGGWWRVLDGGSGLHYYYTADGTTSWEAPDPLGPSPLPPNSDSGSGMPSSLTSPRGSVLRPASFSLAAPGSPERTLIRAPSARDVLLAAAARRARGDSGVVGSPVPPATPRPPPRTGGASSRVPPFSRGASSSHLTAASASASAIVGSRAPALSLGSHSELPPIALPPSLLTTPTPTSTPGSSSSAVSATRPIAVPASRRPSIERKLLSSKAAHGAATAAAAAAAATGAASPIAAVGVSTTAAPPPAADDAAESTTADGSAARARRTRVGAAAAATAAAAASSAAAKPGPAVHVVKARAMRRSSLTLLNSGLAPGVLQAAATGTNAPRKLSMLSVALTEAGGDGGYVDFGAFCTAFSTYLEVDDFTLLAAYFRAFQPVVAVNNIMAGLTALTTGEVRDVMAFAWECYRRPDGYIDVGEFADMLVAAVSAQARSRGVRVADVSALRAGALRLLASVDHAWGAQRLSKDEFESFVLMHEAELLALSASAVEGGDGGGDSAAARDRTGTDV